MNIVLVLIEVVLWSKIGGFGDVFGGFFLVFVVIFRIFLNVMDFCVLVVELF